MKTLFGLLIWCVAATTLHAQSGAADPAKASVDRDGTIHIPSHEVPLSSYMSEAAKDFYRRWDRMLTSEARHDPPPWMGDFDLVRTAESTYPVLLEERMFGGVRTDVVIPKEGILGQNKGRVLINLHGGGFECSRDLQLVESIPIASTAKIKVISVDYRCAPHFKYPAATEDVAAVYKELLKQYKPLNIGIYGCSAGGILAIQSVAWFVKEGLPLPGAIGVFCQADAIEGGDSRFSAPQPESAIPPTSPNPPAQKMAYFAGVDLKNSLVSPTLHLDLLRSFPPTLFITGTRDPEASSVFYAHSQMTKAGVDAELHVWEGMGHNFFFFVGLPESKEMFDVTTRFFNAHLGT
jgi:monoterpene epsilon-lactone hydrolase